MLMLRAHAAYLTKVCRHKWFVFLAGLGTGAPCWRLVIHDWSKFLPSEWSAYVEKFHTTREQYEALDAIGEFGCAELAPYGYFVHDRFEVAWLRHQNRHPHHWEYWVRRGGDALGSPVPMPLWAVREMVADWMGASRAYEGHWPDPSGWGWLLENRPSMVLHSLTQERLDAVILSLSRKGTS